VTFLIRAVVTLSEIADSQRLRTDARRPQPDSAWRPSTADSGPLQAVTGEACARHSLRSLHWGGSDRFGQLRHIGAASRWT